VFSLHFEQVTFVHSRFVLLREQKARLLEAVISPVSFSRRLQKGETAYARRGKREGTDEEEA
jgi:hypothetical protein